MAARKTTAKKAPAAVKEVKAAAEAKIEEVKAETAKVVEEVKVESAKAAEEVKAAAKKAPANKAPVKKAVKKAAVATVTVEFAGRQMAITDIAAKAEAAFKAAHADAEVETIDVYVKPEEGVAYYVVNGQGGDDFKVEL